MGFMDRLMGRPPAKAAAQASRMGPGSNSHPSTQGPATSAQSVRKELVRVAARDTLHHNGIPADWIRVEPLTMSAPSREPGVHVRLVVLHWDPRLMLHAVSLQDNLAKRISVLDPLCERWLMGVSWQFALKHHPAFPPLPHPGSWTSPMPEPAAVAAVPSGTPAGQDHGADVISGPTRIGKTGADAKRDLERMLGERDADFQKSDHGGFERTQPMKF
jgi:hypothetical protein